MQSVFLYLLAQCLDAVGLKRTKTESSAPTLSLSSSTTAAGAIIHRPKLPGVQTAHDSPPVSSTGAHDLTPELFAVFGRYSALSSDEHALFLDLQRQMHAARARAAAAAANTANTPSPPQEVAPVLSAAQLATFAELQTRVQREQDEYHRAVTTHVLLNKGVYAHLHADIDAQIEVMHLRKCVGFMFSLLMHFCFWKVFLGVYFYVSYHFISC